jgi:hypothetical protein
LDGRQLLIKSNPGEVVKPGKCPLNLQGSSVSVWFRYSKLILMTIVCADSFKAINDEGMPMYQRPFMKGKLYIHFTVDFPNRADSSAIYEA